MLDEKLYKELRELLLVLIKEAKINTSPKMAATITELAKVLKR
ncbi:hypothetical protein [Liquorilactobacillus nagelii]|jgi:hypothetical protein